MDGPKNGAWRKAMKFYFRIFLLFGQRFNDCTKNKKKITVIAIKQTDM